MFRPTSLLSVLLLAAVLPAPAQAPSGNRMFNPFQTQFNLAWQLPLTEPVKLIDMAPVTQDRQNNLIMIAARADVHDPRRTLLITHWDGLRFAQDSSFEFLGRSIDTLYAGRFLTRKAPEADAPPAVVAPPDPKSRRPKPRAAGQERQIVTTEGIYSWDGKGVSRMFTAPNDAEVAVVGAEGMEALITGSGDTAQMMTVGDTGPQPSAAGAPSEGPGYVVSGMGTQTFTEGAANDFTPGVRFIQSLWQGRDRWVVGVARGTPAPLPDAPGVTTNDRIVVLTPTLSAHDKPFWALRRDDFEISWRSDPLGGRLFDVRVGDPRGDGHTGILALTGDPLGVGRRLLFYSPIGPGRQP